MIRVGLTGGIGSGKSVVAEIFRHLGVPVYHADAEAKKLYDLPDVVQEISREFGSGVMDSGGTVDFKALASIVFPDPLKLQKLDSIIHPLVEAGFISWLADYRDAPYTVMEAAILFESGFERLFDKTIMVIAPVELCIRRVMARDSVTREQVGQRMKNQWDPELKAERADYVLVNDERQLLLPHVIALHHTLSGLETKA